MNSFHGSGLVRPNTDSPVNNPQKFNQPAKDKELPESLVIPPYPFAVNKIDHSHQNCHAPFQTTQIPNKKFVMAWAVMASPRRFFRSTSP